jgi:hypothetical protein
MSKPACPPVGIDYRRNLEINKHRLDEELTAQAMKMMAVSEAHAQAQYDRDRAKQALDIIKAGLDADIRTELTASQTKFTEAVVDGRIRTAPVYIEAQDKYQKMEYTVNLLLGAVMAFNARRSMLENLVRLFLSGYWSEPNLGGEAKSLQEKGEAKIRDDLNAALNQPEGCPLAIESATPQTAPATPRRPAPIPRKAQ